MILYIVFAFRLPGDELQLIPRWTVSVINESDALVVSNNNQYAFKLGQNLGYFTPEGDVIFSESFPYMATISNSNWATYASNAENIPFYDKAGNLVGNIPASGFPFFSDVGNYLLLPGGCGFSALFADGTINWTYEDISPITAFSPYEKGVFVGYANGKLINFSKDGAILFSSVPSGSNYPVVLGGAASSSGALTACVSGIDKQRFILMETSNRQTKIIFHEFLEGNLREQTFVKFSKDNTKVFFNEKNGLGIVDVNNLKASHLSVEGKILAIEEMDDLNLFFVLTKKDNNYKVYIIENICNLIGSFYFKANYGFILTKDNMLYTGADTTITKTEVIR